MDLSLAELRSGLLFYIIFIASLCLREAARAWTVDKLGDPNPAAQGRVTINPLAHMDLFGSVIFPLVCIFVLKSSFLFGWGKPVIPNPSYFANPKRGEILTALAGPAVNLLVSLVMALVFGIVAHYDPSTEMLFNQILLVNIFLAVFNLIPLPPLDGGVLLKHLIRMSEETFLRIAQWSFLVWLLIFSIPQIRGLILIVIELVAFPFLVLYHVIS
jgi:Zn-dependent protease